MGQQQDNVQGRMPEAGRRLFRSDLNGDRTTDRYGISTSMPTEEYFPETEEHFPEIDPHADRSPDGYDRFGRRIDAATGEPLEPSDRPTEPILYTLHEQQRDDARRLLDNELARDEAIARQHQIDEERHIDRHADWVKQVERDRKYPTNQH